MIRSAVMIILLAMASAKASAGVVFVDNRVTQGGNGTRQWPFTTIGQAVQAGTIIYVAESNAPYIESVTLKKGQMLIGSAFGLDAARVEFRADVGAESFPAVQGPGPAIRGTIATSGDNVIAGCTVFADGVSGIFGSGAIGTLTVRNVYFKTTRAGFAIYLQEQQGKVDITGGAIDATDRGSGIGLDGGYGDIVIDRMPISGEFNAAIRIQGRKSGTVTFRRGSKLRVRDAFDDAVVIAGIERPGAVIFEDTIEVRGRRRGLVVNKVARLVIGGASTLSTANAAALDVRDSGVELSLESVSAEGISPGTLDEGIVLDRVHGHVTITGIEGKVGSGGAVQHARGNGIRIAQTSNVHMTGITLTDSGVNARAKGVRCAGAYDVNSTAVCRAALYLRHVTDSTFENIVVDGGGAMGVNANNVRDVTFSGLDVRRAGDETFESGVLLQEIGGTITFNRSTFADNAGSEMLIEQRYNNGVLILDGCVLSAPGRPEVALQLLEIQSFGAAKLDVAVRSSDMRDSIGSAVEASAAESSTLALSVVDTTMQHFGQRIITAEARQSSHLAVSVHRSQFAAPAVRERAWIEVSGADNAVVCADLAGNRFAAPEGTAAIRLVAAPHSEVRTLGGSGLDARAIASAIATANGGALAVVDGSVTAITTGCP